MVSFRKDLSIPLITRSHKSGCRSWLVQSWSLHHKIVYGTKIQKCVVTLTEIPNSIGGMKKLLEDSKGACANLKTYS